MNELEKQVTRAYRRLGFQRFLGVLGWCWSGALLISLVLIGIDKFYPMGVAAWGWAVGALGLGLAVAAGWMAVTRRGRIDAALEIDRRFGLKERVSSTLALSPEEHETEVGQALVADALRRVGRIDVGSRFGIAPGKQILLPLLPGLLAVVLALIPPMAEKEAAAKPTPTDTQQPVVKAIKPLESRLAERRREAEESGLTDAEHLFKKLEQGARDLVDKRGDRKKVLATLNDLTRELEQRRGQLGVDQVKQQLEQLKNIGPGPAEKFAKAVHQGDFGKAVKELEAIKDALAASDLDEPQKEQLAAQLERMQEQLKDLAEQNQAAQKDLQQQADAARQAGDLAQADQLQQQIDKLMQQAPQMQQLDKLANQLGQCAKCLRQGQGAEAAEALDRLQAGLQQQLDEMAMLDDAMEQFNQAKNQMNCPNCNGMGCEACMGMGMGDDQGKPSMGLGRGRGQGPRPEAEDETDTYLSQVRQKIGRGAGVVTDLVEGPNIRGNVAEAIREEYDAAEREATDPLADRNIPRSYKNHVTEYFDRFREGE